MRRSFSVLTGRLAAFIAWVFARVRKPGSRPAQTVILSPPDSTRIAADGAVRSVQSARVTLPREQLERLWTPENLENLGRTYWLFLGRATAHLTRVDYTDDARSVLLLIRPLRLLRFELPEYELAAGSGRITWRIRDGLLVRPSKRGHGSLQLDVRDISPGTDPAQLTVDVEVENFYPSISMGLGNAFYEATQSFIHVLVTHAFLRSLSSLDLAESKVGKLRD